MVNKCIVNTCNTVKAGDGVTMHPLPADPQFRNVWFHALLDKTGQTVFREGDEICSKHFSSESFGDVDGISVLKADAVPFNFRPDNENFEDETPRAKRLKNNETVSSQCSVFSCKNVSNETLMTQPNLTYYPFPKSKALLTSWKQFCNKTDDDFSQSFVCSDHFTPNDFTNKTETSTGSHPSNTLKPNAIPSIYKTEIKCEEFIEEGEEVITPQNVLQMNFVAGDNIASPTLEDKICGIENCEFKAGERNDVEYYPTSTKKTTTKSFRQTNKRQLQHLAEFMSQNTDLARGLLNTSQGAHKSKDLWYTISECLNAYGPPIKTVNEWQKVWRDQKYLTKKKLSNNLKLNKNGSCSFEQQPLSAVEEAFIEAADLESAIMASEATNQSTIPQNVSNNHSFHDFNLEPEVSISSPQNDDTSIIFNSEEDVSDDECEVKVKQKKFSKTDFMKTYCDTMKSIDLSLKELVTNVNSIVKFNEEQALYRNKMIQIKKAGLALKKEKWIEKRNIALEKLKQKEELMELDLKIKARKLKKLEMSK